MERITSALEAIAVEAPDASELKRIETMAAIANDEMGATRWRMQRALTRNAIPGFVDERWRSLAHEIEARRTAVDRAGIPRFSRRGAIWNTAWIALQLPIVAVALLANLFPLGCAWRAGKRLADAPNTIALWRILVGVPCSSAWLLAVTAVSVAGRMPWLPPAYVAITALGLVVYPELCGRWPKLRNARGCADSRTDAATIAAWVRDVAA
jgi:hypothetical protein